MEGRGDCGGSSQACESVMHDMVMHSSQQQPAMPRRVPDTASKISAEKLIKNNPLVDGSLIDGLTPG